MTTAPQAEAGKNTGGRPGLRSLDRRDLFELRRQFPRRANPASWEETRASRGGVLARVLGKPFAFETPTHQDEVRRGVCSVLDWPAAMPGRTWQQRWAASGAEQAADWRVLAAEATAPGSSETAVRRHQHVCSYGLSILICADVIRPSVSWLLVTLSPKNLAAALARTRDPEGFATLEALCREHATGDATRQRALARIAMIMAAKGGKACDITVGDCLEMVQGSAEAAQAAGRDRAYRSTFFYQLVLPLCRLRPNSRLNAGILMVSAERAT